MNPAARIDSATSTGCRHTPTLPLGPFYPLAPGPVEELDLWRRDPATPASWQRPLLLTGRVLGRSGRPVAGALVEVWQADHAGCYRHPSACGPGPTDAAFRGYGAQRTDVAGCYRFRSIVPGAYGEGDARRAPHVHFQVTGRQDRLVTQMFFPGEPLNAQDRWYCATKRPEQLVAAVVAETAAALTLCWEIVLASG